MTMLLDKDNVLIGRYTRPVDTSFIMVQLGWPGKLNSYHPEALMNEQQIRMMKMERILFHGTQFVRICEDTPDDLFSHEGFEQWSG